MKRLTLVAALVFGVFVVLVLWPGTYIYTKGAGSDLFRINRFTGVKEHATEHGWMTESQESKFAEQQASREQAALQEELLEAIRSGRVARVVDSSGSFSVIYNDHTFASYQFWPNTTDPILTALKSRNIPVETY